MANTGDILLFKSNAFGGFALRVAMNSQFDHVGILIKSGNDEVYLMEAMGHGGV